MDAYELAEWLAFDKFKREGFKEEKPVITHPDQIDQQAWAAQIAVTFFAPAWPRQE